MIRFQKKRKRYRYVLVGGILIVGSFIFIGTLYKGSLPFLDKVSWSGSQQLSQLLATYKENATLKNELATESQAEANVYKLKHENKELTELLKVQNGMKAHNPIAATVIDRSISNWDNELIIDKGAKQGVKVDMNVLNTNGVIGKISKVFSSTSLVELISSDLRTNRMAVILKDKKNVNGTLESYDEKKGNLIVRKIPSDAQVNVGDKVQTSPVSSIFQGGLTLGKVIKVQPDEYGLTQLAVVKPSSTFNDISEVMVIKAKKQ
ncbi:rod shape-determining protein MreC [Bacillus sp. S35]|uniref:rod shape-determining protein MreC n=1 Tax=Priestia aryabhattai TaxID=412384 RepID=UPI001909CC5D|nr:rod shape-determining protein MreC [Priestia aryabhattai]MBK0010555.1 rod shape-determining protein MreC [Bacillus sp. S35]MCM3644730.1 rod shape-determining protein MreC [Priestia aryabhattai]